MDEEGIKITWTPEGVAGVWLASNIPDAGREQQVALGKIINQTWNDAIIKTLEYTMGELGDCPTVSAVEAKLQAMMDEIKHQQRVEKREEEGVDFDPTRP